MIDNTFKAKKSSSNKTGYLDFDKKHIGDTVSFIRGNEVGFVVKNYELVHSMPADGHSGPGFTAKDYSNCFVLVRYSFYHRGSFVSRTSRVRRRSVDLISCRCLLIEKFNNLSF
jgi:hypothetical protein